ncbi:hypothetical protein J6590_079866 [Homalodisca vitripennis]|nr:hypothetical protein J6590_079866 [Homalodisca vitripennis]
MRRLTSLLTYVILNLAFSTTEFSDVMEISPPVIKKSGEERYPGSCGWSGFGLIVTLDLNHHKKLLIACFYIPCNIPGEIYDNLNAVVVITQCAPTDVILLRYFNIPSD